MFPAPRPDELCVRLSPKTRALLEEIKLAGGYASDADAIRAALAVQHHLSRRMAEGYRLYLGASESRIEREVKLPG